MVKFCDDAARVSLAELRARNGLQPRALTVFPALSVKMTDNPASAMLFHWRGGAGENSHVQHWLAFTETATAHGGRRRWFLCPGCNRPCGVVYDAREDFRCRRCCSLSFKSQYAPRARARAYCSGNAL